MIVGFFRFLLIMGLVYLVYQFFKYLLVPSGKKEPPVQETDRKKKKRKVSKEVGEYVDYEEVD